MKRMSQMVHADEPLEEELQGLGAIGAVSGGLVGRQLLGSGVLGFILGAQLMPTLGFIEGPRGDRFRAAGWRAAQWTAQGAVSTRQACGAISEEVARSGLRRHVQRVAFWAWAALKVLDERVGARRSARWARRRLWLRGARLRQRGGEWLAESGLSNQTQKLWARTGVPHKMAWSKHRKVLKARISAVRARERYQQRPRGEGPTDGPMPFGV
mgnify:CR=1 FL=1|jgi:hypothetical protein